MNQNIWGSHLWFSLHTITFSYPDNPTNEDKIEFKNFFHSLANVIPCSVCKKNYKRHIIEHPIDPHLNNKKDLVYWLIDIHNMVNSEIGKKIYDYDTVIKKYENVYNKKIELNVIEPQENFNYNFLKNYRLLYLLLFVLLIYLIYYLTKNYKIIKI